MTVPDFETYARRCVQLMVRPGFMSSPMDSAWLQSTWEEAGVPLVSSMPARNSHRRRSACWCLESFRQGPYSGIERENPGLSAYGVDLWRRHLATCSPPYLAPTLRILRLSAGGSVGHGPCARRRYAPAGATGRTLLDQCLPAACGRYR